MSLLLTPEIAHAFTEALAVGGAVDPLWPRSVQVLVRRAINHPGYQKIYYAMESRPAEERRTAYVAEFLRVEELTPDEREFLEAVLAWRNL